MRALAVLIVAGSLAVAACGGGDAKTDAKVDQIMAKYERTDLSDAEVDEMRGLIDDALDVLPADEHAEYLDVLYESVRDMADAVDSPWQDDQWPSDLTDYFNELNEP